MKQSAGTRRSRFRNERHAARPLQDGDGTAALRQACVDLVRLAAIVCEMPIAYLSRMDGRRHRIVAATGASIPHPYLDVEKCLQWLSQGQNTPLIEKLQPGESNGLALPAEARLFVGMPLQGRDGQLLGTL